MNEEMIREKILGLFREKEVMKDLKEDEDFFELGVSSLTIVELQIVVEKALGLSVPTSTLMVAPTVKEWVEIYKEKAQTQESAESSV